LEYQASLFVKSAQCQFHSACGRQLHFVETSFVSIGTLKRLVEFGGVDVGSFDSYRIIMLLLLLLL